MPHGGHPVPILCELLLDRQALVLQCEDALPRCQAGRPRYQHTGHRIHRRVFGDCVPDGQLGEPVCPGRQDRGLFVTSPHFGLSRLDSISDHLQSATIQLFARPGQVGLAFQGLVEETHFAPEGVDAGRKFRLTTGSAQRTGQAQQHLARSHPVAVGDRQTFDAS